MWRALVLPALMTGLTGRGAMRSGQSECGIMIEGGSLPLPFRMACLASRRKTRRQVIGSRGGFEVGLVTGEAVLGCAGEVPVLVAGFATRRCVSVSQREEGVVVEERAALEMCLLPNARTMALLTVGREAHPLMVGANRLLVVGCMAQDTICRRASILDWRLLPVTSGAIRIGVGSSQG